MDVKRRVNGAAGEIKLELSLLEELADIEAQLQPFREDILEITEGLDL